MVKRRKVLAGLGSIAAGGAAVMGTGAFSGVRADRAINVETAGDVDAYLGLDASVSVYANQTGKTLELAFDGSHSGQRGDGLNANADSVFQNVFKIQNNGTNTIQVDLFADSLGGSFAGTPMAMYWTDEAHADVALSDENAFGASDRPSWHSGGFQSPVLDPGEDVYVHVGFYLNSETDQLDSNDINDVPNTLVIYAEARNPSGDPL